MSSSTQGKVAIVTGASAGIGKATAIALSAAGWKLVLSGRRENALEETAKLCSGPAPVVCPGDVQSEDYVVSLFKTTHEAFGRIDMVFNNAGIAHAQIPWEEMPLSKWLEVMNTNVTGTFLCTREAFKYFKAQTPQGGRIINNGSISAHTPRPFTAPYTASKHAILGLTKCTSLDGRPFNIACTQIDVGNALTEMAMPNTQGTLQANGTRLNEPSFDAKHVADAVVHIAGLPNEVTVLYMNLIATGMPFVGRG
ncbi:short-chain dehydrogenase/reductase SDR [Schizopora paradoxa]|uniref:Short-chain dehydrogenase/reductase SDR n=1 Tax=Schizopora paradoxa TaxID=27342 RepID=A0A0H2RYT8_9AGAM|nr:short-chain dehydrogenase/reductase SDR [Schizopora paradoxa]